MNKTVFIFIFISTFCFSQSSGKLDRFYELINSQNVDGAKAHLELWELEDSKDPDLFIGYFNYYLFKSQSVEMQIVDNPEEYEMVQIINADTISKVEDAVYAIPKASYDFDILSKGISQIDKGINIYPNRLDMRFGKVYVYNLIKDYKASSEEIIGIVNHSRDINNNWLWANNEKLADAEQAMLSTIQDYIIEYTYSDDSLIYDYIENVSNAILSIYPEHIVSMSNLGIVYSQKKEFEKSLEVLLKAHILDPNDLVVISNIAKTYEDINDLPNALKYYKLLKKIGTKDAKSFAAQKIKSLKD